MISRATPSAALVAANKRLHELRTQTKPQRPMGGRCLACVTVNSGQFAVIAGLPAHLGWGSEPVTQAIRAIPHPLPAQTAPPAQTTPGEALCAVSPPQQTGNRRKAAQIDVDDAPDLRGAVKVYPDIALGMLRQQQAAAGRLWLLLRYVDMAGTGVLRVVNIERLLTSSETTWRLCGRRQLQNLLRQGEGIFWRRDKTRLWLRSAGKVAAGLGVLRLNGRPVAIPVKHLLGNVGEARAYLYASFHAGRQPANGDAAQKPIARDTLTVLSGTSAESQRAYERRVGVRVSRNYAVGEGGSAVKREEQIWQRGGAAFEFVDHHGRQGKPGRVYMAWQLPNSYHAALSHRPKGRQKRINQALADLFMQGMTGNGQCVEKQYFGEAAQAAKSVQKRGKTAEVYWSQKQDVNGRLRMWYTLALVGE